ncbi:hypothetical protein XENTR_v10012298 [Xenopus tropicalis]|uniref:Protein AKNAD1 isoform X2 n=1 Tax=Xenopus tropicalis TaxID=8364 RepID=A0A8J0SLM7_XENTR|nr:protein AKNAD1 isoform X2 [Xenopus tropicalis]KAE8610999.1 hypothetical protein XENTR_v10012298 [Xenopus tropicalis]
MEENDTTGDEQEDLPYDGILECYLTSNIDQEDINYLGEDTGGYQYVIHLGKEKAHSLNSAECVKAELLPSKNIDASSFSQQTISVTFDASDLSLSSKVNSKSLEYQSTVIPDTLHNHFNGDSLFNECNFIDHEAIPECSLADSINGDVMSKISFLDSNKDNAQSKQMEDQEKYYFEREYIKPFNNKVAFISNEDLSIDASIQETNVEINCGLLRAEHISIKELQPTETDIINKGLQERRHSFHDIKYGQGQVNYKLQDLTKIHPKVKIPNGKDSSRSVPNLQRSRSSPSMIEPSAMVRELQDSMQPSSEPINIKDTVKASDQGSPHGSSIYELDIQYSETDHNLFPDNLSKQLKDSWRSKESDTTGDEQEDLPYDGILECYLMPNVNQFDISNSSEDAGGLQNVINLEEKGKCYSPNGAECVKEELLIPSENIDASNASELPLSSKGNSKSTVIPDVLLRHFKEDSLLNPCNFIDCETFPELSLIESIDETVISKLSFLDYNNDSAQSERSEDQKKYFLERDKEPLNIQNECTSNQEHVTDFYFQERDGVTNHGSSAESMEIKELQPTEIDKTYKEHRYQERRHSSYDIKYGQGQVHYKLPDFSKIPPKVKIPKGNGSSRSVPTLHRSRSSPSMIKSSAVVRELLDTMQPFSETVNITETIEASALLGQTSALLGQVSQAPQRLTSVPLSVTETSGQPLNHQNCSEGPTQEYMTDIPFQAVNLAHKEECVRAANFQLPTEGEKMADMLRKEAQQLQVKVEKLSNNIVKESLPLKEQCLIFQDLKSSVEALELDYLFKKEKHRQMQLQAYRAESQMVGEFDLEREVEGQIFRLEMLLENIQEQLNAKVPSTESSANSYDTAVSSISKQAHRNSETLMHAVDLSFTEQNMDQSSGKVTGRKSPAVTPAYNDIHSSCIYLNAQGVSAEHRSAKSNQETYVSKLRTYGEQRPTAQNRYLRAEAAIKRKMMSSGRRNGTRVTKEVDTAENSLPECDDIEDSCSLEDSFGSDWTSSHSQISENRSYVSWIKKDHIREESQKQKSRRPHTPEYYGKLNLGKVKLNKHRKSMPACRGNVQAPTLEFSRLAGLASSHQTAVSADQRNLEFIDCKMLNFALDKAIRTARNMQRVTERMVTSLAAGQATGISSWRSESHW